MSEEEFYKPLVANGPRRKVAETESEYKTIWIEHAFDIDDLLSMAVTGGLIADRLSWVFVAGYQAACRHAFANCSFDGWVAYAATEDRKGNPPLPAVSWDQKSDTVSGVKTWVAAAKTVDQLIIKIGTGADARYGLVHRNTENLTIETGRTPRFLSELTQGLAHFDHDQGSDVEILTGDQIHLFGLLEPLYIYAAFCGFVFGSTTEHDLVTCGRDCLDGVEPALRSVGTDNLDRDNLQKAEARAQDLLVRLSGNRIKASGDWDIDQRLIAMYSKSIRRQ